MRGSVQEEHEPRLRPQHAQLMLVPQRQSNHGLEQLLRRHVHPSLCLSSPLPELQWDPPPSAPFASSGPGRPASNASQTRPRTRPVPQPLVHPPALCPRWAST